MENYVYVLAEDGSPLMPTTRYGRVRRLLKEKKAEVKRRKPFTIRLLYTPETQVTQEVTLGIDPGRTNIGLAAVRSDGTCLFAAECVTRNKEIRKLMQKRKGHRMASRRGERLVRKRRARKHHTLLSKGQLERKLPGYGKGTVTVKDIINTEAKFNNRKRPAGWLTPTATQLLRTHLNLVGIVRKILPVAAVALEANRFVFMDMENGGKLKWGRDYQRGPMHGFRTQLEALSAQQGGKCLLCRRRPVEHAHHIVPKSQRGSDTLANKAGLCAKCHARVHTDREAAADLAKRKEGLVKKYGALSVLNQVIPYLAEGLSAMFRGCVYFNSGYETGQCRDASGLEKSHCVDAYCIACSGRGIPLVDGALSEGGGYVIRQFRRHDRARIQYQRERTYYLGKEKVALNRKPRAEQKGEALSGWFSRMEEAYGKTEAEHLRSGLRVKKSYRSYNTPGRVLPGAVCLYQGKYFIMGGQQNEGDYYYPLGEKKKLVPSKDITVACQKGLVFI